MSLKKYNVKENYNHAGTRKIPFYQLRQSTTSIGYNPVIPHGRG